MITTSLYNILESELQAKGFDEYFNEGKITAFDPAFSLLQKMMKFDTDVSIIVTDLFFNGFIFPGDWDHLFKKIFTQRFLYREINRQMVEEFATKVVYTSLVNQVFIEAVFTDLMVYVQNETTNTQNNINHAESLGVVDGATTNDNRQLETELPQDNINLNVDDTVLNYGNRNNISRNKNKNDQTNTNTTDGTQNNTSVTRVKNLETFLKSNGVMEDIFVIYDKNCFLQTW